MIGERPTLFCLHFLGGSAREWAGVARIVGARFAVVAIDLPGFGDAADVPGYTVREMAQRVAREIRKTAPRRWMIAGHSMGAKIAAVVARDAEDGASGLAGLIGLVFAAGSPPGPEPMGEGDRNEMLGWFDGDAESSLSQARQYVANNSGPQLPAGSAADAVEDVLRANRAAWRAWLTGGSREDWSAYVGVLQTPTILVAGSNDRNLGPAAQRAHAAPHFANVRLVALPNAKHLLPIECPAEVARLIEELAYPIGEGSERVLTGNAAYRALIASERVSAGTREALLARARPDDPAYEPVALTAQAYAVLRAVTERIVPQHAKVAIDIAARIDGQLASGTGDGWRFAELPPDVQAYRRGLATLDAVALARHGETFVDLDAALQDAMLAGTARGELGSSATEHASHDLLNAQQMRSWFDDLRADAVKFYIAHPQTLAILGYSGIANGGDGTPKSGFVRVGLGQREAWEPVAAPERAP